MSAAFTPSIFEMNSELIFIILPLAAALVTIAVAAVVTDCTCVFPLIVVSAAMFGFAILNP
jgi:hypothetical protein